MDLFDAFSLPYLLGILVILLSFYYLYMTKDYDYWKKQGVPGDKPIFLIGTLYPLWIRPLHVQDMERLKKYGLYYGGFEGSIPVLYSSDPEMIKQVMVKDFDAFPVRRRFVAFENDKIMGKMLSILEGNEWKTVRSTLSPTFTTGKLKQMIYLIEECAESSCKRLEEYAKTGKPVDILKDVAIASVDVIASCAFGMKLDTENPNSEFMTKARGAFRSNSVVQNYFALLLTTFYSLAPILKRIPHPFTYFGDVANKVIDMRLNSTEPPRRDFLQIMLEAEEIDNDDPVSEKKPTEEKITTLPKKSLSRDCVVAQAALFLLAGHETTANTLGLLLFELAKHSDIQEKLINEIDEVTTNYKGQVTYEAISNMVYLDMVLSETLRIYPPGTRTERRCMVDEYNLNGIKFKKGAMFVVPIYSLHHNPEFYPNPEEFLPDRFSPENKKLRNPYTYLPFGVGPRNCIAMRFALMEIKLLAIHFLLKFRFLLCSETDMDCVKAGGFGMLQPSAIHLQVQNRADKSHY